MIYFRPMSLTKSLRLTDEKNKKAFQQQAIKNHDTIDIAPKNILYDELVVHINEKIAQILKIQKILEYAHGAYMFGYMIQIMKPNKTMPYSGGYDKISIILHSKETNEIGKGEVFVKKKE